MEYSKSKLKSSSDIDINIKYYLNKKTPVSFVLIL
jgi:hypothetical protein